MPAHNSWGEIKTDIPIIWGKEISRIRFGLGTISEVFPYTNSDAHWGYEYYPSYNYGFMTMSPYRDLNKGIKVSLDAIRSYICKVTIQNEPIGDILTTRQANVTLSVEYSTEYLTRTDTRSWGALLPMQQTDERKKYYWLFGRGTNASLNNSYFYGLDVYDLNENLYAQFVPCYRKSDNAVGVYERISGKFFTPNYRASAVLNVGPDVNT